ncbi:MAG: hypothetical protein K8F91_03120, partial [Candidatus Obscuribacterales bacterium]|nr:hypothetical protein [Candidatus Obscuribacterales bacterium]
MGKALLGLSKSRMWRGSNFLSLLLVLLFCSANFLPHAGLSRALAQDSVFDEPKESETQYVKPTMLVSSDALVPGGKIRLAVRFDLLPHWHIYYKEAGDAGMPTTVDWQLPKGFEAGPLLWEKPARFSDSGIVTYGYETSTIVASDISIPVDLSQDKKVTLKADLKWLSCKDICIPGEGAVSMDLPVGKTASPTKDSEALGKLNESWMLSQLDKKTDKTDENKDSAIASDSKGLLYYFAFAIV